MENAADEETKLGREYFAIGRICDNDWPHLLSGTAI